MAGFLLLFYFKKLQLIVLEHHLYITRCSLSIRRKDHESPTYHVNGSSIT